MTDSSSLISSISVGTGSLTSAGTNASGSSKSSKLKRKRKNKRGKELGGSVLEECADKGKKKAKVISEDEKSEGSKSLDSATPLIRNTTGVKESRRTPTEASELTEKGTKKGVENVNSSNCNDDGGDDNGSETLTGETKKIAKNESAPKENVARSKESPGAASAAPQKKKKGNAKAEEAAATDASASAPNPQKKKKGSMVNLILDELRRECGPVNTKMLAKNLRTTENVLSSMLPRLCDSKNDKKPLVKKKQFGDSGKKVVYFANQKHKENRVEKVDEDALQSLKVSNETRLRS